MQCQTLLIDDAPAVRLNGPAGDSVTVLLRGGQVISWIGSDGVERLYCSPASPLKGPQAVRGGVPVIFPQFAARGPLTRHGWARLRDWTLMSTDASASAPQVVLQLANAIGDDPLWPHACTCTLVVALLPQGLRITMSVENIGSTALTFQAALHSYFAVADVTQSTVTGVLPDGQVLCLREPIDQVFESVRSPLLLDNAAGLLHMEYAGFEDVVVWNPGPEAKLSDLPEGGYRKFVCVEPAVIAKPVTLDIRAQWEGVMLISYNPAHF